MGAPLHRADGSATYSANGYTILGSVNGPIEVQRRDELPEEAAIEINIRPASGVGGQSLYKHSISALTLIEALNRTKRTPPRIHNPRNPHPRNPHT